MFADRKMEKLLSKISQNGFFHEGNFLSKIEQNGIPEEVDVIEEVKERKNINFEKLQKLKVFYTKKPKQRIKVPGSYKSVLNRKNKDLGCLFLETRAKENDIVKDKVEGNFVLLARKRYDIRKTPSTHPKQTKPIVQYSEVCILCKLNYVVPKIQGKPWRKHSYIDIDGNPLGVMITRNTTEFSVHQACMDYAHGKVFENLIF